MEQLLLRKRQYQRHGFERAKSLLGTKARKRYQNNLTNTDSKFEYNGVKYNSQKDVDDAKALYLASGSGTAAYHVGGGDLKAIKKEVVDSTGGSTTSDTSESKNAAQAVNVTQGLKAVTTNKAGFHQDKMTPERQEAMKQSALNQAMGGVLKSLTGTEGGVSDAAGAYMQQRQGIVDKYNEQISKDNIAGFSSNNSLSMDSSVSEDKKNVKSSSTNKTFNNDPANQKNTLVRSGVNFKSDAAKTEAAQYLQKHGLSISFATGTNNGETQIDVSNPEHIKSLNSMRHSYNTDFKNLSPEVQEQLSGLLAQGEQAINSGGQR